MTPIFHPFAFQSTGLDQNAIDFINATGIQNESVKNSINTFVVDLKSNGLWSKMTILYPFVTDATNSTDAIDDFKFNLINTSSYTASFNNGTSVTQSFGGFLVNSGTSTRMSTPYQFANGTRPAFHVAWYTTQSVGFDVANFGNYAASNGTYGGHRTRYTTGTNTSNIYFAPRDGAEYVAQISGSAISGLIVGTTNGTDIRLYRQGVYLSGSLASGSFSGNQTTTFIGQFNSTTFVSNIRHQYFSIGSELTAEEVSTLNTIVNKFQVDVGAALGVTRNV